MKLQNLRINQLSPAACEWYLAYLAAMDARDIEAYGAFLSGSASLLMNNDDPVRGKAAVLEMLARYWPTFAAIEHDLLNIYGTDDRFVLEALNYYQRLDGSRVTLRAVAFTDRDAAGRVDSVRLYADTGPLFNPQAGD